MQKPETDHNRFVDPNDKPMPEESFSKKIELEVKTQLAEGFFTTRKLTDTPTDALQVVNRRYVTMNGTTSSRPTSSVIGQFYFDTTLASGKGKPVWYGPSGWVDATGTNV